MFIDQLLKDLLHFTCVYLPIHMDTQALPGLLIDDVEHSKFAPSLSRVMNKTPRPDMPTVLTLVGSPVDTPCRLRLGFFAGTANPSSHRSL